MSGLLYIKLDASYDDDEKVILAGEKAELLFVRSLCLAKRILSDGFIADAHLPKFGLSSVAKRAQKLVEVGLWDRDDDAKGFWICAWLKHNRSAVEVDGIREKRRLAGKAGGQASAASRASQANAEANVNQSASAKLNQTLNPKEVDRGGETEAEAEPLAPAKPTRKPDLIFEALIEACSLDIDELTKSGRGRVNTAAKELRDVGATPEGIRARAKIHLQRWPDAELTPTSLSTNYAQLSTPNGRKSTLPGERYSEVDRFSAEAFLTEKDGTVAKEMQG